MDREMSTMKDIIIWEEKNLTELSKKLENNGESDECVTTISISESKENVLSKGITKISGIYKIVNKTNGKYYVGSAKNIRCRWNGHRHLLNKNTHKNPHFQSAWNKYGKNNFDWIIVEKVPKEKLIEIEQKYLDIAKVEQNKCYNKSFLADRIEMTPQVIDKIRKSNRNRVWTKESLEKLSKIHTGQKHTEETKKKLRTILKGHFVSKETRHKIGNSRINLKISKTYNIKNIKTNEVFNGNYYDLIKKLDMSKRSVSNLINGHINKCKDWMICQLL